MECHYHPDLKAVTTCKICGQPICKQCSISMASGDIWCYSCFKKREEKRVKILRSFRIVAIIGVILWILVLFLNIKEHGTGGIIRGLIIGFFVACLPISYFYNSNMMESPEAAKTSVIIKFIVRLILGPFILVKAIKFYKFLEEGGKANERIEKELEEANTKDFCDFFDRDIIYLEDDIKELEKAYDAEKMKLLKDNLRFTKESIEDEKMKKEGENGKIKDEVLKNYSERLEKIIERIKALDKKHPSSISIYDKLPFQKVEKMNQENNINKRKKTKEEEEYIEIKRDLYIENILDMENKIKKLEINYNVQDLKALKNDIEYRNITIESELYKPNNSYGKMDDEVLEIFDERLKNLRERLETLESKYQ